MVLFQSLSFTSLFLLFHPEDACQPYQGKCPLCSQSKEQKPSQKMDRIDIFLNKTYRWLLLLLLISHFSRVWLCVTPQTAARQALPSLGFSRQEHWSVLPFPSPMHESEKLKWSRLVMSDSETPWTAAFQAPPSMGFSRQEHWSGLPFPSPMHESEKLQWSRSVVSDFVTPWTAAYQAPPSMGFSRQEYWSGVPLPSPPM